MKHSAPFYAKMVLCCRIMAPGLPSERRNTFGSLVIERDDVPDSCPYIVEHVVESDR